MGAAQLNDATTLGVAIQCVGIVLSLVGILVSVRQGRGTPTRDRTTAPLYAYVVLTGITALAVFASFYWHADLRDSGDERAGLLSLWTNSMAWEKDPTIAWLVWFVLMLSFAKLPRILPKGGAKTSVTSVFDFSGVLLFGPAGACLLSGVSDILSNFGRPCIRMLFNFFQMILTVTATALVFRVGGRFGQDLRIDSVASFVALTCAALTYYFVNSLLVARAIAWHERISYAHAWRRNFEDQFPGVFLILLPVGTLLAVCQAEFGYAGLLISIPVVILAHLAYDGRLTRSTIQRDVLLLMAAETDRTCEGSENHSLRIAAYSVRVAWEMDASPDEAWNVEAAALMHNFTSLAVRGILVKEGELEKDDWSDLEKHPAIARDVLEKVPGLEDAAWALYRHHEQPDGRGYPAGIRDIPLEPRILMVVDAFDAMIHQRPHGGPTKSPEEAYQELRRHSGTQFCPEVVETMIRLHQQGRLDEEFDRALEDLSLLRSLRNPVRGRRGHHAARTRPEPSASWKRPSSRRRTPQPTKSEGAEE